MITKLAKAVLDKHGPMVLVVDEQDRIGLYRKDDPSHYTLWNFSLISVLIRWLAEDKL